MRALMAGVSALLLASMPDATADAARNDPACVENITARVEGSCERSTMHEQSADRRLIAQQESTPTPAEGAGRSSMPQATRQQKLKTCEFGATDQKLTGAARKAFMARCLASDDTRGPKASAKPKAQQ
jgi:hypothetical protein